MALIHKELNALFVVINVKINREKLKNKKHKDGQSREDGTTLKPVPVKERMYLSHLNLCLLLVHNSL